MIQLNLLPDLKKEFLKAQKAKALVISVSILVTLGAFGLSALLFVYVTFVQQFQIDLASGNIKSQLEQLKGINDIDKYLTLQNQLKSLPDLHANKGSYSRLLTFLNILNPGAPHNVSFSTLQLVAADKTILLTGTAPNYKTFNIFVDTLKNTQITYLAGGQGVPVSQNMFDAVLIQSSGLVRAGGYNLVGFTVKTIFPDSLFAVGNTQMTAKVPNITTTPSVTQSPHPVFDDQGGSQ